MSRMTMRMRTATSALGISLLAATALQAEDVMIVYDASGSMWGQIDGVSKIEIAREVMGDLLDTWPADANLGLVAYGHRQEGVCTDIETVVPLGPVDRGAFLDVVSAIRPLGRTPLAAAVQHAAEELSWRERAATVVLISDGIENCQADPCALAGQLAEQGIAFTTHVIGFDLASHEHRELACIAESTGGLFLPAQDAAELAAAVQQVGAAIAEAGPAPAPALEPEPELPEASIMGPATATAGETFAVSWSAPIHAQDRIVIAPMGAGARDWAGSLRTGSGTEGRLTAPAEPGLYELRYILNQGNVILAAASIEVLMAEASISGPEEIRAGDSIRITWSAPIHSQDRIVIAPMGAESRDWTRSLRTGSNTEGSLTAPDAPGLYELRYILNQGNLILASQVIEVLDATAALDDGASLSVPETAAPGETVIVTWTGGSDGADQRIALARADQPLFSWISAQPINPEGALSFTMPDATGFYEFRYLDISNQGLLSRTMIELR